VLPPLSIKHVPPQCVPFGYPGMIEISGEVALHADALHHSARPLITGSGKGNNFL
jgi:hypothetical protein